jgi:hypothetical protein
MWLCIIGIPLILCSLEIIKYVQYLVCISRQNVLQRSHSTDSNLSVLLTRVTIQFATFMFVSLEHSTGRAAFLALTNRFLIRGALLTVREARLAPKMSVTFGAGYFNCGKGAQRPSHTIAAGLVTTVCDFTCARFVTCFTHKPFRRRARYIHDHVIMLTSHSNIMSSHARP